MTGYQKEDPTPEETEDFVTILYAGQAASLHFLRDDSRRPGRATRDAIAVESLLAQLDDPKADERLWKRAQRIVLEKWGDIELLARALLVLRTVEVDQAHALLNGGSKAFEQVTGVKVPQLPQLDLA